MAHAPQPPDEERRLSALRALDVLDTPPEAEFDALVQAASMVCGTPISLVSLIDSERQWIKANVGLPGLTETPREVAFCAHAILQDDILEIRDATADDRFVDNPLVTSDPNIRFYAGATLKLSEGTHAGTLCVIDRKPGRLDDRQRQILSHLAKAAADLLEGRRALHAERRLREEFALATRDLAVSEERFRTLSEASPLGVFATDPHGLCLYNNSRWQEIYGLSLEESLGDGWSSTIHPEDREAVFSEWQRSAEAGQDFDMEFRIKRPAGPVRYVRAQSRPSRDQDGTITGHIGSVEDVTEARATRERLVAEQIRLASIIEGTGVGTWEWNVQTGEARFNERWAEIVGWSLAELGPTSIQTWLDLGHPEDLQRSEELLERHFAGESPLYECEARMRHREGHWVWVLDRGRVLTRTPDGQPEWMFGTHLDITERKWRDEALRKSEALLNRTGEVAGVGGWELDLETGGLMWTAQTRAIHGVAPEYQPTLDSAIHFYEPAARAVITAAVERAIATGDGWDLELPLVRADGQRIWVRAVGNADFASDKPVRLWGAFQDITAQHRLISEMTYHARHDALTGLINRSEFESRLRQLVDRTLNSDRTHALMYLDLDQFKLINDSCGHSVGDEVLKQVGRLLGDCIGKDDILARLGGDEFGIVLTSRTIDEAQRIAEMICLRMEDFRFVDKERRYRIGASIGLVAIDARSGTIEALMQAADLSCYAAKDAGRNRVHVWSDADELVQTRQGEMQWASRIERALDEGRFVLHAQRIYPLAAGESGLRAEVLLRMRAADGSLVMPGAFLPAAERYHLASRIDAWVLKAVIAALRTSDHLAGIASISVNLSGQSVGDRTFHGQAINLLMEAGPTLCRLLCLEITETAAVTNLTDARDFIRRAKELGVSVALDDFGAGASSFGYLKRLPVDVIKIDGQFIQNLGTEPLDEAAVRCFIDVAQVMGVQTVAEFVDDDRVAAMVRQMGVDFAQGFHLHKPECLTALLNGLGHTDPQ